MDISKRVKTSKSTSIIVPGEADDDKDAGGGRVMEALLWTLSVFLCCVTLPFSLFWIFKQVQVRLFQIGSILINI